MCFLSILKVIKLFKPNHYFKASLNKFFKLNECEQVCKTNGRKRRKNIIIHETLLQTVIRYYEYSEQIS